MHPATEPGPSFKPNRKPIMKLTITINCGNAAFDPEPEFEVARILRDLADRIDSHGINAVSFIRNVNGNQVSALHATHSEGDAA